MAASRSSPHEGSRAVPGGLLHLEVSSPDFDEGHRIPKRHAHRPEGEDVLPTIEWASVPAGTLELALICDDPDAPRKDPWVHWVLIGIPRTATSTEDGPFTDGANDYGGRGWGGPFPPEGDGDHHYRFKVYALNTRLPLKAGATKDDVLEAIQGHVLAEGELVGTYSR